MKKRYRAAALALVLAFLVTCWRRAGWLDVLWVLQHLYFAFYDRLTQERLRMPLRYSGCSRTAQTERFSLPCCTRSRTTGALRRCSSAPQAWGWPFSRSSMLWVCVSPSGELSSTSRRPYTSKGSEVQ